MGKFRHTFTAYTSPMLLQNKGFGIPGFDLKVISINGQAKAANIGGTDADTYSDMTEGVEFVIETNDDNKKNIQSALTNYNGGASIINPQLKSSENVDDSVKTANGTFKQTK